MKTVAETLKPPFIAAIMLDTIEANINDGPSPSDEMLSIAPVQKGFLGLETTIDEQGRWISISYWRDEPCFANWRKSGALHVKALFNGLSLDKACKFRLSKVDDNILLSRPLMAEERAIPSSAAAISLRSFGSRVFNAFPVIGELLGNEHAR